MAVVKLLAEQDVAAALAALTRKLAEHSPADLWPEALATLQECLEASGLVLLRADGQTLTPIAAVGRPTSSLPSTLDDRLAPARGAYRLEYAHELQGALLVSGVSGRKLTGLQPVLAPLLAFTALLLRQSRSEDSILAGTGALRPSPRASIRPETFDALHQLALMSQHVFEPERIAQFAVDHVRDLLRVDHAALYAWDDDLSGLRPLADNDELAPVRGLVLAAGSGVSGIAFQTREPCVVEDYPGWERATPEGLQRGIRSAVSVPLIVGDRAVGALTARTYQPRRFTQEEIALLGLFGAGVAPALEITRILGESERRRATAAALAELVRQGAADPDPEGVVSLVTREAVALLGADYAAVALFEPRSDDDSQRLVWQGVWGNRSSIWRPGRPAALGGTAERSISRGETVVAERLGENPEFPWSSMPVHQAEGARTVLSTPLLARGRSIGALVVGWRTDHTVLRRERTLAEALASYAGTMIDYARVHAQTVARTRELDASVRELEASQARLRALYEAVSCGVLVRDRSGAIVHANAAAQQIFGASWEDMVGKRQGATPWRLLHLDGRPLRPDEHPSSVVARSGQPVRRAVFAVLRPDGQRRWLQADSAPIFGPDGQIDQIVSSFIDITERIDAEAALKAFNEELEQRVQERTADLAAAYRELEGFSYSVSHDLRAPLRGIDGLSLVVLEEYGDRLDERGRDYLQRVRAATQRLGRLLDALLGLFRVSRIEMRREWVDLAALAAGVLADLSQSQPQRDVRIVLPDHLLAYGDPDLLRLALQNLLGNAWKFTGRVARPEIELGSCEQAGETVYFVRDNGAGFDMAYASKLFRPFERLHEPAEFEGDGVGLATVERVVQRHGGRIWAEGAVGAGATFYFTLRGGGSDGR